MARPVPALLDPPAGRIGDGTGSRQTRTTTPNRAGPSAQTKEKSMIDVVQQINAVQRQVGSRVLEAGEARTVTISQTYDATIDDVWDACTNVDRIPRWVLPISGQLRVGGRYQLEGNAAGTIQRCDPPNSFAA